MAVTGSPMVTHYMLRTHDEKYVFSGKNTLFVPDLELIKSLIKVKKKRLLLTCAPIYEIPSNINTMNTTMALVSDGNSEHVTHK